MGRACASSLFRSTSLKSTTDVESEILSDRATPKIGGQPIK